MKENKKGDRLHEDDPELEREFRMLAELMVETYLSKMKREDLKKGQEPSSGSKSHEG